MSEVARTGGDYRQWCVVVSTHALRAIDHPSSATSRYEAPRASALASAALPSSALRWTPARMAAARNSEKARKYGQAATDPRPARRQYALTKSASEGMPALAASGVAPLMNTDP